MAETFQRLDLSKKLTVLQQLGQGIKTMCSSVSTGVLRLFGKSQEVIPSTYRLARDYKDILFPEQENVDGVIQLLRDKYTVDVGSGIIHREQEGLPSLLTTQYPESKYLCVEPRLAYPVGHPKGFPENLQAPNENLLHVIENSRADLVAAMGEQLPFADESMDYYLSCYLMPWHISSPKILIQFLSEIRRVLKVGGEVRLGPLSQANLDSLTKNQAIRQYLHDHFEVQLYTNTYGENDQVQWEGFDYSLRLLRTS